MVKVCEYDAVDLISPFLGAVDDKFCMYETAKVIKVFTQ